MSANVGTILTEREAREAAVNGAVVEERIAPPYLPCVVCRGDGSNIKPYEMGCPGPHPSGWVVIGQRCLCLYMQLAEDRWTHQPKSYCPIHGRSARVWEGSQQHAADQG